MKHLYLSAMVGLIAVLLLSGCQALDVVARDAIKSFQTVLAHPDVGSKYDPDARAWVITTPGGEEFRWSEDFSGVGPDFTLAIDARPFLDAGLDATRLPGDTYALNSARGQLILEFEVGSTPFSAGGESTPAAAFSRLVEAYRERVSYHAQFDHYGIALGEGNMFEWAKDLSSNDKDLVLVLNPEPLQVAGVDPSQVKQWVFGKVKVKDEAGQEVEVDKFLRPYDLP